MSKKNEITSTKLYKGNKKKHTNKHTAIKVILLIDFYITSSPHLFYSIYIYNKIFITVLIQQVLIQQVL